MKRAGFTMIELIFVIVILGILSAVALPKFIGVSEQAKAAKCKAFVGTLNRTVLPAIWAEGILTGTSDANMPAYFTAGRMDSQIDIPVECTSTGVLTTATDYATVIGGGIGTQFTMTIGASDYNVSMDSNATTSETPHFVFGKV